MPIRSDTPHDRPRKAPRWVSPWSFDDEWEDEQRRHASLWTSRPPEVREEIQDEVKTAVRPAPVEPPVAVAAPVSEAVLPSARAFPEVIEISDPVSAGKAAAPAVAAATEVHEDERFRPPQERPREVVRSRSTAAVPEKRAPAAPPPRPEPEAPRKKPLPRPAPARGNILHEAKPMFRLWTVLAAALGMAGILLMASIFLLDAAPVADKELALRVPLDTAPEIDGPERLGTFLQAVNTLENLDLAMKPASKWDNPVLQSFIQGNGAALDALRDLLGSFDWHPHHAAWHLEDWGEHRAWPHVRVLLQARVENLLRRSEPRLGLEAAMDLIRLSRHLEEMWSWPSYMLRAQELHLAGVQSCAIVLRDAQLAPEVLKGLQEQFMALMPSDEHLQGALAACYLHQKKLILGAASGEPLDTMPRGDILGRPGRLFFKKQETLGLFAKASQQLRDQVAKAPFSLDPPVPKKTLAGNWLEPNGAGKAYFIEQTQPLWEVPVHHHLAQARHQLVTVLFAVRRYLAEHQKLPGSLDELRPAYLPDVPVDPWSGETLRYDGLKGLLFSAGDDLVYAGGRPTQPPLADPAEPTLEIGVKPAVAVPGSGS